MRGGASIPWCRFASGASQSGTGALYFNQVAKGGHFASWEEPQLFSEELRAAFRSLRPSISSSKP